MHTQLLRFGRRDRCLLRQHVSNLLHAAEFELSFLQALGPLLLLREPDLDVDARRSVRHLVLVNFVPKTRVPLLGHHLLGLRVLLLDRKV